MRLGRLLWLGVGAATGVYVVDRWRRNLAGESPPLRDYRGRSLVPRLVELEGGETVPVIEAGTGPALMLIPGLSGDPEVFRYQVPALSAAGYRVIVAGLRSDYQGVEPRFDQFAHDVATVLDAVGVSSACLLGLSFGGPVAIRFATLYPERAWALILTATLARFDLSHVGLNRTLLIPVARLATRFVPQVLARPLADVWGRWGIWVYDPSAGNERVIDYELDAPARVPAVVGNARLNTFRGYDLRAELERIEQPALVIAGAADSYTPPEWLHEIAQLLPDSELVEIPRGGHLSLISHAEVFNQVVLDWLAELEAGEPLGRPPAVAG